MLMLRLAVSIFSCGMLVLSAGGVCGQAYPNKPIRIVTGGMGGGSSDFTARVIAQGISGTLGQRVIVDNRGSGAIRRQIVAKAAADGYTLLLAGSPVMTETPVVQKAPYDPVRDFMPISLLTRTPTVLVVHPSVPVNSVKELIAYARARPGDLNYTTSSAGGSGHVAAELFKAMAGVDIIRIAYRDGAQEIIDLIAGRVQLTFSSPALVTPLVRSGRLRALAVTSSQPSALFPGMPTMAAVLPGYESVSITGIFAPANTPETIINRLNKEVVRVLNQPGVKQKFFNIGIEVVGGTPEQLAAAMKSETARLAKIMRRRRWRGHGQCRR